MSRDLLVGERRQADVLDRGNDKYKVTQVRRSVVCLWKSKEASVAGRE